MAGLGLVLRDGRLLAMSSKPGCWTLRHRTRLCSRTRRGLAQAIGGRGARRSACCRFGRGRCGYSRTASSGRGGAGSNTLRSGRSSLGRCGLRLDGATGRVRGIQCRRRLGLGRSIAMLDDLEFLNVGHDVVGMGISGCNEELSSAKLRLTIVRLVVATSFSKTATNFPSSSVAQPRGKL
jgi:hypothetical protein